MSASYTQTIRDLRDFFLILEHSSCCSAVSSAAPKLWNALPVPQRECSLKVAFKESLQTYLF